MTVATETKPAAEEKAAQITGAEATRMALDEAMSLDPTVLVFGEDVADPEGGGNWGATQGLSTKYGTRCRSTAISEQAIAGAAVGAAIAGMRPVAEIMLMNFITVAMDQIVNHAAKTRFMSGGQTGVPLTIRTSAGAGRGLGAQHSDMLEAWFAHVPGLKVVVPRNQADWKGLLLSCILDDDPCIFIENTLLMKTRGEAPPPNYRLELGKAAVIKPGTDVTVVGYGRPLNDVLVVAQQLEAEAISVEVVDVRTIVPMDEATILESAAKTGRVLVIHEAVKKFGVGAEISSRIHEELFSTLKAPVARLGSRYSPVPYARHLEEAYLWTKQSIETAIRQLLR